MQRPLFIRATFCTPLAFLAALMLTCSAGAATPSLEDVTKQTGHTGGLIVHLPATDGGFEAAVAADGRFLVQGLAADRETADRLRQSLAERGVIGLASVTTLLKPGQLPYHSDSVNVLVADLDALGDRAPATKELHRVLAPGQGVLFAKKDGRWQVLFRKPADASMRDWTHHKVTAGGSAVTTDPVQPPNVVQWTAGPFVGRTGYGIRTLDGKAIHEGAALTPPPWRTHFPVEVYCRDAFSGTLLWSHHVKNRNNQNIFVGSGRVFIQDDDSKMMALDIETGEVANRYEHSLLMATEVKRRWDQPYYNFHADGVIVQLQGNLIQAMDVESGKVLWSHKLSDEHLYKGAAGDGTVFALIAEDGAKKKRTGYDYGEPPVKRIVAYDLKSGKELWSNTDARGKYITFLMTDAGTVVGVNFMQPAGTGDGVRGGSDHNFGIGIDAQSGKTLFTRTEFSPADGASPHNQQMGMLGSKVIVLSKNYSYAFDARTGKDVFGPVLGPSAGECFFYRGTPEFRIHGSGMFSGYNGEAHDRNLTRTECWAALNPALGMLFMAPTVAIQNGRMHVNGWTAMSRQDIVPLDDDAARLESGPAKVAADATGWPKADEWPTFLGNPQRTFSTAASPAEQLELKWKVDVAMPSPADGPIARDWKGNPKVAGRVTPPTIAAGKVFVAVPDAHRVDAFDAASGEKAWSYTAGGRVDTPPTIAGGLAVFGSRDGWVYAVDAASGKLAWRFFAGPSQRYIQAFGQMESLYPLVGSVTIHDGGVYVIAGLHGGIEPGLLLWKLELATGKPQLKRPITGMHVRNELLLSFPAKDVLVFNGGVIDPKTGEPGGEDSLPWSMYPDEGGKTGGLSWVRYTPEGRRMPWNYANRFSSNVLLTDPRMAVAADGRVFTVGETGYRGKIAAYQPESDGTVRQVEIKETDDNGKTRTRRQVPTQYEVPLGEEIGGVEAVLVAGDTLVIAASGGRRTDFEGHRLLRLYNTADGSVKSTLTFDGKLAIHPEGLAAAYGRIYVLTEQGQLLCFAGK